MAHSKEQRALARQGERDGYQLEPRRSGHWRLSAPCGCYMTFSNSPRHSGGTEAAQRDYRKFHATHRGGSCR